MTSVAPSPELEMRMRNTHKLIKMMEERMLNKDQLEKRIEKNPAEFIDLNTYYKLMELKPWKNKLD